MATLDLIILLVAVVGLAYFRTPVIIWTLTVGVVLVLLTFFGKLNLFFLFLCWILFLAAAGFANLKSYRQKYFTKPLVQTLQKTMPAISDTEREAIEAGNVWWEKELFCGRPDWKKLLAIPQPQLSA